METTPPTERSAGLPEGWQDGHASTPVEGWPMEDATAWTATPESLASDWSEAAGQDAEPLLLEAGQTSLTFSRGKLAVDGLFERWPKIRYGGRTSFENMFELGPEYVEDSSGPSEMTTTALGGLVVGRENFAQEVLGQPEQPLQQNESDEWALAT